MIEQQTGEVLRFRWSGRWMQVVGAGLVIAALALATAAGSIIGLIIGPIIGLGWIAFGAPRFLTVDRGRKVVTIEHRYPIRPSLREIPFEDLASLTIDRKVGQGRHRCHVMLTTTAGERARLVPMGLPLREAEQVARRIAAHVAIDGFDVHDEVVTYGLGGPSAAPVHAAEQQSVGQHTDRVERGVRWEVVSATFMQSPVGKWTTPDARLPSGFVLVGQRRPAGPLARSRMVEGWSLRTVGRGYDLCDPARLKQARVERVADLGRSWAVMASDPEATRYLLRPPVVGALERWSSRYPVRTQVGSTREHSSPLALFADERGLTIALPGHLGGERLRLVTELGIELVSALGGPSD